MVQKSQLTTWDGSSNPLVNNGISTTCPSTSWCVQQRTISSSSEGEKTTSWNDQEAEAKAEAHAHLAVADGMTRSSGSDSPAAFATQAIVQPTHAMMWCETGYTSQS